MQSNLALRNYCLFENALQASMSFVTRLWDVFYPLDLSVWLFSSSFVKYSYLGRHLDKKKSRNAKLQCYKGARVKTWNCQQTIQRYSIPGQALGCQKGGAEAVCSKYLAFNLRLSEVQGASKKCSKFSNNKSLFFFDGQSCWKFAALFLTHVLYSIARMIFRTLWQFEYWKVVTYWLFKVVA